MKPSNRIQKKIQRISYSGLQKRLKALYTDLSLASTKEQKNYFEMEICVLEDYLASKISKGRI